MPNFSRTRYALNSKRSKKKKVNANHWQKVQDLAVASYLSLIEMDFFLLGILMSNNRVRQKKMCKYKLKSESSDAQEIQSENTDQGARYGRACHLSWEGVSNMTYEFLKNS